MPFGYGNSDSLVEKTSLCQVGAAFCVHAVAGIPVLGRSFFNIFPRAQNLQGIRGDYPAHSHNPVINPANGIVLLHPDQNLVLFWWQILEFVILFVCAKPIYFGAKALAKRFHVSLLRLQLIKLRSLHRLKLCKLRFVHGLKLRYLRFQCRNLGVRINRKKSIINGLRPSVAVPEKSLHVPKRGIRTGIKNIE